MNILYRPIVFLAVFALMGCAAIRADASSLGDSRTAKWADVGTWSVYGNTEHRNCSAGAAYFTGQTLSVVFDHETVSLVLTGQTVVEGQRYELPTTTAGAKTSEGTLVATATNDTTLIFRDLHPDTVKILMNSDSISFKGLQGYDLTGSKAAMISAWECYQALNSL